MKILEALHRVDRSEANGDLDRGIPDDLAREFGFNEHDFDYHDDRLKDLASYWLVRWNCTDSWVGGRAYYLQGVPIAFSWQEGRKCYEEFTFVSPEARKQTYDWLVSVRTQSEMPEGTRFLTDNYEIADLHTVSWQNSLLDYEGFVDDRPAKIDQEENRQLRVKNHKDYLFSKAIVHFDDGTSKEIEIEEFKIPLKVK